MSITRRRSSGFVPEAFCFKGPGRIEGVVGCLQANHALIAHEPSRCRTENRGQGRELIWLMFGQWQANQDGLFGKLILSRSLVTGWIWSALHGM